MEDKDFVMVIFLSFQWKKKLFFCDRQ